MTLLLPPYCRLPCDIALMSVRHCSGNTTKPLYELCTLSTLYIPVCHLQASRLLCLYTLVYPGSIAQKWRQSSLLGYYWGTLWAWGTWPACAQTVTCLLSRLRLCFFRHFFLLLLSWSACLTLHSTGLPYLEMEGQPQQRWQNSTTEVG